MNKPIPKKEVAIEVCIKSVRYIKFWSTEDAVTEFAKFGNIQKENSGENVYYICVDPRYDFEEVLSYIENYG